MCSVASSTHNFFFNMYNEQRSVLRLKTLRLRARSCVRWHELTAFMCFTIEYVPVHNAIKILYEKLKIEDEKRKSEENECVPFRFCYRWSNVCGMRICTVSTMHKHVCYWTMIAFYFLLSCCCYENHCLYFRNNQMQFYAQENLLHLNQISLVTLWFSLDILRADFYELHHFCICKFHCHLL